MKTMFKLFFLNRKSLQLFPLLLIFLSNTGFSQQAITYPVYGDSSDVLEVSCIEIRNNYLLCAVYDFSNGNDMVVILRSTNAGVSWDSITTFMNDSAYHGYIDPYLTIDSAGTIFFVAMRGVPVPGFPLNGHDSWIHKSTDDGLSWTLSGQSPNSGPSTGTDFPRINAWSADQLILSYMEIASPQPVISVCTSIDAGATWITNQFTAASGHFVGGSSVKKGIGNNLYLSYTDLTNSKSYFSSSTNGGVSWLPADTIGSFYSIGYFYLTSIISNPALSDIGVLSHAAHHFENVFYYNRNSIGVWSRTLIDTASAYAEGSMDSSGILHVAYCKNIGNNLYLYYCYSFNNGLSFSVPFAADSIKLTGSLGTAMMGDYNAIFRTSDGKIHITWCANYGNKINAKHTVITNPVSIMETELESTNYNVIYSSGQHQLQISNRTLKPFSVQLIDLSGRVVKNQLIKRTTQIINTDGLTKGIYLLSIKEELEKFSIKTSIY